MSTNQNKKNQDRYFMNLALQQANKVLGNTSENPAVGCVIVKNGNLISAGHTGFNGIPHAESNAIVSLKEKCINSSLYVTLEPCSNYGKTPPCVNLITNSKIKKVFFAVNDPDTRSYKKSSKFLKSKRVLVKSNLLKKEVNFFYRSYYNFKKKRLPFVTCKLALSKDYFTINKKKRWITNDFSRGRVHLMRSKHDCIITSYKTVNIDNPLLNCRIDGLNKRSPARIILDKNLSININSKILKYAYKYKTYIFYNKTNQNKINLLKKLKVKSFKSPVNSTNKLDLENILVKAKNLGFSRLFLETGIGLSKAFLDHNLVNDLKIFMSKEKLNNNGSGNIRFYLNSIIKNKRKKIEKVNLFGEKLFSIKLK